MATELRQMSIDDAQHLHEVLDALEDAEWRASQPKPRDNW
jgi:hypothetical protein